MTWKMWQFHCVRCQTLSAKPVARTHGWVRGTGDCQFISTQKWWEQTLVILTRGSKEKKLTPAALTRRMQRINISPSWNRIQAFCRAIKKYSTTNPYQVSVLLRKNTQFRRNNDETSVVVAMLAIQFYKLKTLHMYSYGTAIASWAQALCISLPLLVLLILTFLLASLSNCKRLLV